MNGLYIKEVAKKNGFTLKKLAEKMDISPVALALTIKKKGIRLDTLVKYANAIGCNVVDFFQNPDEIPNETVVRQTTENRQERHICPVCGSHLHINIEVEDENSQLGTW